MILIEEIKPVKQTGRTSLKVTFKYDPVIVNAIKTVPNGLYNKKEVFWEFPMSSLGSLLDTLTFIDDIDLKLQNDNFKVDRNIDTNENALFSSTNLTQTEIDQFRVKPFQHQIDAINYLLDPSHDKALLLDGMGLGKTLESIYLAETLYKRGQVKHCLIICGINAVKQNWKKEINKFSSLSCRILGEKISKKGNISYASIANRVEELQNEIDPFFVITNIESLRDDKIVNAINKSPNEFDLIIVDEVHRAGGKSATQGNNLLKLKAKYKVALTGTLITNNPLSCYTALSWTENEKATMTNYKSTYCEFGGFGGYQVIGYKNLDLLRDEIEGCSIRRTLDQVRSDIPPKQVDFELIELDDDHTKFYDAIKQGIKEEADKISLSSSNLLALTTRLRQATACPSILTTNPVDSTKILRAIDIIEDVVEQGEKIVVLSNFVEPVRQICRILESHGYSALQCTGDIKDEVISNNVDKFQNDPSCKIICGTHSKMGTGLTLNAAMYELMIDTPFTYASFAQSCDRIWRINNTRPAYIKVLVAANTIDERVQDIIEKKKDLGDFLVDGQVNESFTDTLRSIILDL